MKSITKKLSALMTGLMTAVCALCAMLPGAVRAGAVQIPPDFYAAMLSEGISAEEIQSVQNLYLDGREWFGYVNFVGTALSTDSWSVLFSQGYDPMQCDLPSVYSTDYYRFPPVYGTLTTIWFPGPAYRYAFQFHATATNVPLFRVYFNTEIDYAPPAGIVVNALKNGSTAQVSTNFRYGTVMAGDFDCDGSISISDSIAIQQYVAGSYSGTCNVYAGDVNGSGSVDLNDSSVIMQYLSGSLTTFYAYFVGE